MANVTKNDGATETFDRAKLERSIRNAGVDETTARKIAEEVPEKNTTTRDIRNTVTTRLRAVNKEAADVYNRTIRLAARKTMDAVKGVARMTTNNMDRLRIRAGDALDILHGDRRHSVRAETTTDAKREEIQLHEEDLKAIGAESGTRIATARRN